MYVLQEHSFSHYALIQIVMIRLLRKQMYGMYQ